MSLRHPITLLVLTSALSACGNWPFVRKASVPRPGPHEKGFDLTSQEQTRAYWIRPDTLLWPPSEASTEAVALVRSWRLVEELGSSQRVTTLDEAGTFDAADPDFARFPYLTGYLKLTAADLPAKVAPALRNGRFSVASVRADGSVVQATAVQTFGVIDTLYTYDGSDLGASFDANGSPTLKLWAPTARSVSLQVYATSQAASPRLVVPLVAGDKGVWSVHGDTSWYGQYYLYDVEVYVPSTGRVEHNLVTDPYSVNVAANGTRSQIVDLNASELKPIGWDELRKPALERFEDIVLYELHVRDFSASEAHLGSEDQRGGFLAFTARESDGMRHLKTLADAGLTHVHLLPVFDFNSVNEDKATWQAPVIPPADQVRPETLQAAVAAVKNVDAFNWGYDPFHYNVPEGSYATNADGTSRVTEMRAMVQALAESGLRVVMDVVYNHTADVGQGAHSVLDKIVPNYYYRLDRNGAVQRSTCCPDTASEHAMMEKLLVDSVVQWARQYKIDGFRFDLMGHHTTGNLRRVRRALDSLTLERDGVDGRKIYLYGEGWKFGSLDAILPLEACTQLNSPGLGIGTFNDRLRDRARGGNYERGNLANPGFLTGLYYDFNGRTDLAMVPSDLESQRRLLLAYEDVIKVGLAGNLRDYSFTAADGRVRRGAEVDYNGAPAGYASAPRETINYVSAHDNYTLWDHIAAKAPFATPGRSPATATTAERVAMQELGIGLVALGQGIPFFDAGIEILRSKSGDDNSHDSGDLFNRLDYSKENNNFGIGLPSLEANGAEAGPFWEPRLADANFSPSAAQISGTADYFRAMLRIRKSSSLFRLATAQEIQTRVRFLGTTATPGVIVMKILGDAKQPSLIVAFNVTRDAVTIADNALQDPTLQLHPEMVALKRAEIQAANIDGASGTITVPARALLVLTGH